MTIKTHAALFAAAMLSAAPAAAQNVTPAANSPQQFVETAAVSNLFEIESSRLALESAEDEAVQAFAQRMVDDHTAAGEKMKAAVEAEGDLTVPTELDAKHQEMMTQLEAASGGDFDRLYTQMQVQAHEEAVALFESFASAGSGGELQAFAAATLPTLKAHYEEIQSIAQ